MEVYDVSKIIADWIDEGPVGLSTCDDRGWPSRVADIILANIDRKIKLGTTVHQPSPSDSSGSLT